MAGTTLTPNPPPPAPSAGANGGSAPVSASGIWSKPSHATASVLIGILLLLAGWNLFGESRRTRPTELNRSGLELPKAIDLNRASRTELLQLPETGPALADKILAYRQLHGPFRTVEELHAVPGIGESTLNRLKPFLQLDLSDSEDLSETEPLKLQRKPTGAKTAPGIHVSNKPNFDGLIDVNYASLKEIQTLPGIGPVFAKRIIEEREKKFFTRIEDLKRVSGIGPKRMEQLRDRLIFESR